MMFQNHFDNTNLTALEGGDRVDSDHSARTGTAGIGTWTTSEGNSRPDHFRAYVPVLLCVRGLCADISTDSTKETMRVR
jgi:hypothetical protein